MHKIITSIIIFNSILCSSQDNSFGVMFDVTNTTLTVPNGELNINAGNGGISEGADNTGYETNFAIGVYGSFYVQDHINVGVELFYDKTTSKDLDNVKFSAINLVPYYDADVFRINLFLNIGVGVGYILDSPDFDIPSLETEKFDVFAKLALAYKFQGIGRIEIGAYPSITSVVKDNLTRSKFYFGIKLPLNEYLKK